MTSLPTIYPHPSPLKTLVPHLLPHLPYSIPLLRRIQFHYTTASTHVLATIAPEIPRKPSDPIRFAATSVDFARAPETECWIYSSHEHDSQPGVLRRRYPPGQDGDSLDEASLIRRDAEAAKHHILALLHHIASLPSASPLLVIGTLNEVLLPLLAGTDLSHIKPQKVMVRTMEQARAPGAAEGRQGVLVGTSVLYQKWIADPGSASRDSKLPEGYAFSTVRMEELELCMSRTAIPRSASTLKRASGAAVRYEEELVAWAFLGVDGSVINLYVEAGHRGKGLAQAVAKRLFARLAEDPVGMGFRAHEEGNREDAGWSSNDIGVENWESAGVAKGLGAWKGWKVRWVTVDLGAVKQVAEREYGSGFKRDGWKTSVGTWKL